MPIESDAWNEVGPAESFSEVKKRVRGWLERNLPVDGQIVLVVGHGATLNAAIEYFSPTAFKGSNRDKYGNIVEKAGIWLLEWSNGKIIFCGPIQG